MGEQNLEAIAFKVTANCQAQGMDKQETVNNRMDTHHVDKNPKIYWTFKDEKLKHKKGWTIQIADVKKSFMLSVLQGNGLFIGVALGYHKLAA